MSVLILPTAILGVLFAQEILIIWTQDPVTVAHTSLLVALLMIGTALNGLMNLPYALQLAHGWTALALYTNVISVILLIPLLVVVTANYGATGAATIWIVLNSAYVLIQLQIMHRRLLKGEQWRWYFEDVGLPLAASFAIIGIGRLLLPNFLSLPVMIASLIALFLLALLSAALAASQIRIWVLNKIETWKTAYGS